MTKIPTNALRAKLLENGQVQRAATRNGSDDPQPIDPHPVVKLFTPDAGATWLLTELDPEDDDLAFGLMDLGLGEPELRRCIPDHGHHGFDGTGELLDAWV
jgi:Protein of unknown function (DUF2958)